MDKSERKKLVSQYKEIFFPPGVLVIKNKINNKIFISSSLNVEKLVNRYLAELRTGGHMNKALQKEWQEFGEEHFSIEIVEKIKERKDPGVDYKFAIKEATARWMQKLNPYGDRGYH